MAAPDPADPFAVHDVSTFMLTVVVADAEAWHSRLSEALFLLHFTQFHDT